MMRVRLFSLLALAALIVAAPTQAGRSSGNKDEGKKPSPQVTGDWTGTWGVLGKMEQGPQMRLDCKVVSMGKEKWQATFEGECGRPYKYTIKMLGRQAGNVVLFKGTADLGKEDGGVYDWIGRATESEFVGFYTSQGYTGTFKLTRPK
jgi:hypothetical protein